MTGSNTAMVLQIKKFNLHIVDVLDGGDVSEDPHTADGAHIHSDFLNGLKTVESTAKMISWVEATTVGTQQIYYTFTD